MLLATQCPHCFTSFRVANDQLKLHAGLVRCGACQQTFNGIEYLLAPGVKPAMAPVNPAIPAAESLTANTTTPEVFTSLPVAIPEIGSTPESDLLAPFRAIEIAPITNYAEIAQQHQFERKEPHSSSALEFDLGADAFPGIAKTEVDLTPEPEPEPDDECHIQADLLTIIPLINEDNDDHIARETQLEPSLDTEVRLNDVEDELSEEDEVRENTDVEKPDFVIQAEKQQRRSLVVRTSMIILSTLLFFSFLMQGAYSLRHQMAVRFPQSKASLQEVCKYLRCRIELPTQIELISIESNELQALSSDKNIFSLAIHLQNKSSTLQAWPMLELILNDAKDLPVLQRVFTPADYLANKNDLIKGFAANSEQPIKLYFELSGPKAAGYHVGVFYP
jgi:predicted Zn finger-like uncharacterized protein